MYDLKETIRQHWEERQPKRFQRLEAEGSLADAIEEAYQRTLDAYGEAIESGLSVEQAWDAVRELWEFPPGELE